MKNIFFLLLISLTKSLLANCITNPQGIIQLQENWTVRNNSFKTEQSKNSDLFELRTHPLAKLKIIIKNGHKKITSTYTDSLGRFYFNEKICGKNLSIWSELNNSDIAIKKNYIHAQSYKLSHELKSKNSFIINEQSNNRLFSAYLYFYITSQMWKVVSSMRSDFPKPQIIFPALFTWSNFITHHVPIGPLDSPLGKNNIVSSYAIVHEYLHMWWYKHLFNPSFESFLPYLGPADNFGTHDFLEKKDVAFFEKFAMVTTEYLIPEIFPGSQRRDEFGNVNPLPYTYPWILKNFYQTKELSGILNHQKIDHLIFYNQREWQVRLFQNLDFVRSLIRILYTKNWFQYDYIGDQFSLMTADQMIQAIKNNDITFEKYPLINMELQNPIPHAPNPLFTPKSLFQALSDWSIDSNGNLNGNNGGLDDFLKYLSTSSRYSHLYQGIDKILIEKYIDPNSFK